MKKIIAAAVLAVFHFSVVFSLDFAFKIEPSAVIPLADHMETAFGALAFGGVDLFNFTTVGLEGGYLYEKPENTENAINTMFGGVNVGFYYYPLSRLYLGLGAAAGMDYGVTQIQTVNQDGETVTGNRNFSDIYYRAYGEVGFRINPTVSINATGGYASFCIDKGKNFITGPFAGLSLRLSAHAGSGTSRSSVSVKIVQDSDVYPVYSSVYDYEPFGTIIIKNNDGAELRHVHVSFRASKYTSGAKLCGTASRINRHQKVEFTLCANFSDVILSFTENGKISGEVVI